MHRSTQRTIILASMVVSLAAGDARADIGPPPTCPAGLAPSYFRGHFCAAIDCTSDAQCGSEKCVERPVCLHQRDVPDPELETGNGSNSSPLEYEGECASSTKCSLGTCVTKKICTTSGASATDGDVPPGGVLPPGAKHGCGCSIPGGPVGATFCAFGLLGGIALLLGRRRGRR